MERLESEDAYALRVMKSKLRVVLVALTLSLGASPASAALSSSDLAQVRQFVTTAQIANAERVRALLARPDLSLEESVGALREALAPVAFTEARRAFLKELVFGGASVASRSILATAAARGAIARADEILSKFSADLDGHPDATRELLGIYGFIDAEIANAGPRRGIGVAPQTGISLQTYDDCATSLAAHIEHNPRWLKADAPLSPATTTVRAQAQIAFADLTNPSPTWRVEVADRLAMTGARRSFLTDLGILELDSGKMDNLAVERVRSVLGRLAAARLDAEGIFFGEERPLLRSRGQILFVPPRGRAADAPSNASDWGDEVEPAPTDAAASALALELAGVAVRRALDNRGELRVQADRDVRAVTDGKQLLGKPRAATPEAALAGAVQLLVLDAPRTLDLAFARFTFGHPESAAIVSDALGVLAAFAPGVATPQAGLSSAGRGEGLAIALGKPRDGGSETTLATAVRLLPNGAVTGFTLAGHRWELTRGDTGTVTSVRRDMRP